MKIIDLLNKIANSKDYKDIPKKVKITTGTLNENYRIWVWEGCWYIYEEDGSSVCICTNKLDLNDEVEIIEEEPRDINMCGSWFTKSEYDKLAHSEEEKKIPEKIPYQFSLNYIYCNINETAKEEIDKTINHIYDKINEIIDYLKSKGE